MYTKVSGKGSFSIKLHIYYCVYGHIRKAPFVVRICFDILLFSIYHVYTLLNYTNYVLYFYVRILSASIGKTEKSEIFFF